MTFEVFSWGPRFMTGIPIIDGQHQRLVDLNNQLGRVLIGDEEVVLADIAAEVKAYAEYHFRTEEGVWESAGLPAETCEHHRDEHREFVLLVEHLGNELCDKPADYARLLHDFLSSWLIFHILDEDHSLARKVLSQLPEEALATRTIPVEPSRSERTSLLEEANTSLILERDLLAQTSRQLDETRTRLLENEKLASIGQLAAGVAHEINNPIGFVNSNLSTLGEYLDDTFAVLDAYAATEPLIARDPQAIAAVRAAKAEREIAFVREDAQSLLTESRDGLSRVTKIVLDLKTFSHVDRAEWAKIDLRVGLESTINIVWSELRHKAELRRELNDIPQVLCNAGQLNQVFMNLLVNAAQAIEQHGLITIRTGSGEGERSDEVWVEVEDNGCGIPPEHQARLFEPFFTTKPVGKGTGLGLSLSWGIVQKHGGRIEVTSKSGQGTCFRVCLPVEGPAAEKEETKS
jgi:two-component system, NtrC family, sensor kinase